jgi:hypothetical protein
MELNIGINAYLSAKVGVKAVFGRYKAKTPLKIQDEYGLSISISRTPGKTGRTNAI